ncbi:MAG: Asp-tRNA(Asn)/Glu-tRNA(Gln) amidotransferase subunit GatB [Dehalococcoidia bacterium]|nr:Asp-tRNA(Asn)/Glu-tRNA(Gln) amidotransferase subunit GatB [Dehalococcoidia bacterium]
MEFRTVIGLEVHAQLLTESKMFCRCSTNYINSSPNTHVCPVCLGMPGALPTINRQAVEYTIMTALALNCTIPGFTKFDRKNYPYPDLMKGYQISQYDMPLSHDGWVEIEVHGQKKRAGITRVHLEEDVAKLLHRTDSSGETYSLMDVNRAGMPLMEIVGEPDLSSAEEARIYLMKLHTYLRYLRVCTGNMEEGSFRCDANISQRSSDGQKSFPKVEVKNMNSFKSVYSALKYEEERQRKVISEGGRLVQETRGWVDDKGITLSQRSKEYAHDYRYFPEPDLPPLSLSSEWVEGIRARLPELPDARRDRFVIQYKLSDYDADLLTSSREFADYFESAVGIASPEQLSKGRAKTIANWMSGEFLKLLNIAGAEISQSRITPHQLNGMLDAIDQGTLSTTLAKQVFGEMFSTGKSASQIVVEKGLTQISGAEEIDRIIDQVLRDNPKAVSDFKEGKEQSLKFLVGQIMKNTKGRAKPDLVNKLLKEKLR